MIDYHQIMGSVTPPNAIENQLLLEQTSFCKQITHKQK